MKDNGARKGNWLGRGGMLAVLCLAMTASAKGVPVVVTLTDAEKASLAFMREEEKVARDVYLHLYAVWGSRPFAKIAASEQTHMDALGRLLTRYGVPDPAARLAAGVFANPELQALYNELAARGDVSLADAYAVGVFVEEADIADLDAALAGTTVKNLVTVYKNLRSASVKHLAAFTSYLAALGAAPATAP